MKILLMTSSDHLDYSADCDCAVLDVTPKLLKRIRSRIKIAGQAAAGDRRLWELCFLGCGPDYYKYDLAETCAEVAERTRDLGLQGWFSKFEGEGGVGDMQFCIVADDFKENMKFDGAQ